MVEDKDREKWGLDSSGIEIQNKSTVVTSAVATGARGGRVALTTACAPPPILVYSENDFGTSRNDNTTGNNGKRDNKVQT